MVMLPDCPPEYKRVWVGGSRGFSDYFLLAETLSKLLSKTAKFVVLTGGAKGADRLAERWVSQRPADGRPKVCLIFHPDPDRHGTPACFHVRNRELAAYCTHAVFFWDGTSPGTKGCIDLALKTLKDPKRVKVVRYAG